MFVWFMFENMAVFCSSPLLYLVGAFSDGSSLFTCEYDGVETRFSPELHEVDHVPKPEGRVPRKHHARLPEIVAEVAVDAGVVLQLVGLNELEQVYKKSMQIVISRPGWKEEHAGGGGDQKKLKNTNKSY